MTAGSVAGPNGEGGTFTAGQRRRLRIRARSRPTARSSAGGCDDVGQVSGPNAEGGTFTRRVERRRRAYLRDQDGWRRWSAGGSRTSGRCGRAQRRGRHVHPCPRWELRATTRASIKADGTLECWGQRRRRAGLRAEQPRVAASPSVARASRGTCAIKTDGTLECWGGDFGGRVAGPNAEGGTFSRVSMRLRAHVRDQDERDARMLGPATVSGGDAGPTPRAARFIEVSAGDGYTCAIKTDGIARVLGRTTSPGRYRCRTPRAALSRRSAPAGTHTCALKTDGTLECWGDDSSGEDSVPTDEGGTFVAVTTGHNSVRDQDRWHAQMLGLRLRR